MKRENLPRSVALFLLGPKRGFHNPFRWHLYILYLLFFIAVLCFITHTKAT